MTDRPDPPRPHLTNAADDPDAGPGPAYVVILLPIIVALVMFAGFLVYMLQTL